MTPTSQHLIGAGLCCLLVVLTVLLLGAVAFTHMSRRGSADDIGSEVEERELAEGINRLAAEGRIEDVFGYRDGRKS